MCILPALTLHLVTTETATTSTLGNETLGGLSAREKPELSEHLSVLIGEDVAKNIEYKRLIEQAELGASPQQQPYLTTPSTPANQKSRIQVKTAPNGVDYEYEYVYYYYDEDEDNNKTSASAVPSRDNKNHYEIADVTAKVPEDESANEGRASKISSGEDERLPKNTRFPPREILPVTSEPAAKIVVKHPSSDFVDSDTFNTADNRNSPATTTQSPKDAVMEKAAFDLYAILQNEKMTMDPTEINTIHIDPTTLPPTTEINTFAPEPPRLPTRRTTTIQSPIAETQRPPVNPLPVVAKAASSLKNEQTASASPWIRSKNKQSSFTTTTTTTTTTERASFAPKSRYNKGGNTSNRVNSFARTLSTTVPSTTQAERSESRPSFGGRSTRNRSRFNIQPTTESLTTAAASASESRPSRPRASFSGRSRNKTPSSTTTTASGEVVVSTEASTTAQARVTLPNRLGVNRLLAQRNRNNLIRHGSPTTAKPNVTASTETDEGNTSQEAAAAYVPLTTEEPERVESTSSQTGLNRLKNRPRIQIHPIDRTKAPTTQNVIFNQRKVNPLIARRQFGLTSSTSEAPSSADETLEESDDKEKADTEPEPEEEDETTEAAPSSEAPHGLRLLDPHRRLSLRRPGTITRRQRDIGSSYAI
ncbi:hypothetical protein DMENIID0001_167730 [Sergentomyia squamirostris]